MSEAEDVAFKEMFPLVIGLLAGLAVFFIVIANIIAGSQKTAYAPAGMTGEQAIAQRVAPIGEVNMGGPILAETDAGGGGGAMASDEPQTAEQIYSGVCSACHDTGVAGAPKLGNTSAWQERLGARGGYDALFQNALNGFKGMPARGGASISDEELDGAVPYMLAASGVSP